MRIIASLLITLSLTACLEDSSNKTQTANDSAQTQKAEDVVQSASRFQKEIGLDVRTSVELQVNPAPGSLHIPITQLKSSVEAQIPDKNVAIKVFCQSGGRASRAVSILNELGYKNVTNINSWKDWNKMQGK